MKLRAFFDAGSGVLVWAGDAESRARWTSAVELAELDVPEPLRAEAAALAARHDALFDWNDPARGEPWRTADGAALLADARRWLERLRGAVRPRCEIADEFGGCAR